MPDMRIRRAAPADLPVLTRLWQAAFGDPPELIERFYRRFPPAMAAWVVEAGGCVVTAAHLLQGRLHTADGGVLPCAYVYAVSTDPAHQGNGYASALMRRFAMDADASGRVLYTLPAEASLYKWYQAVMGTTQTARGERIRIARQQTDGALPSVTRISAPEYAVLRAQQLQGQTYAEPSAALLDFQADLCSMSGGALVRVGSGCAVVERDGDTLIIKELLVLTPHLRRRRCSQPLTHRRHRCVCKGKTAHSRWRRIVRFAAIQRIYSGGSIWTEQKLHGSVIIFLLFA